MMWLEHDPYAPWLEHAPYAPWSASRRAEGTRSGKGPSKTDVSGAMAIYAERRNQLLAESGMPYFNLTRQDHHYKWGDILNGNFRGWRDISPLT